MLPEEVRGEKEGDGRNEGGKWGGKGGGREGELYCMRNLIYIEEVSRRWTKWYIWCSLITWGSENVF